MTSGSAIVSVSCDPAGDAGLRAEAGRVAAEAGLPLAEASEVGGRLADGGQPEILLVVTATRLELRVIRAPGAPGGPGEPAGEAGLAGGSPVAVDLLKVDATTGQGRSLRQPLARAVGLRKGEPLRPRVVDATAGFGEDAWLLASLGCDVTAVERSPVMAALLADGLRRAGHLRPEVASRMRVVRGEAAVVLRALAGRADVKTGSEEALEEVIQSAGTDGKEAGVVSRPEVVYLDPMFPSDPRKAMERKPMRVLRALVGGDADAGELLEAALAAATRRVVVKRPGRAAPLGGRAPVSSHAGQSVRYDVYVPGKGGGANSE